MSVEHSISVGKLRQNPTEELRSVQRGQCFLVTDRGRPIAQLSPIDQETWIPGSQLQTRFHPVDPEFGTDITQSRVETTSEPSW